MKVAGDGRNLLSHAGLPLLLEVADRTGLTRGLSEAMATCGIAWHTHDPGVVLVHVAASIAGGGRFLSDLEALRHSGEVYGPVASTSTAWRALGATACTELRAIPAAVAAARAKVWAQSPPQGLLVLDFDATLVDAHSEKEDAAATYKRGFGFHPLGSWCDNTREPLAVLQRPGNAGSNDADDHCELLDASLAALPPDYQIGHQIGDHPDDVKHPILVRADTAGATHDFVRALVEANCEYSIGFPINGNVRDALLLAQEEHWAPAVETNGEHRDGAWVTELTHLIDLSGWDPNARLIVRRERPHPGAQLSLFDTHMGYRHTCFITPTTSNDLAQLELRHRGHARVEDRVRCWKACGMDNLPFDSFCRNQAWTAVTLIAGALISWLQLLGFNGDLARAEPKTLRHRIFGVAATIAHRGHDLIIRLDQTWPWTPDILRAYGRIRAAFP